MFNFYFYSYINESYFHPATAITLSGFWVQIGIIGFQLLGVSTAIYENKAKIHITRVNIIPFITGKISFFFSLIIPLLYWVFWFLLYTL
jgi:hypothetical protein